MDGSPAACPHRSECLLLIISSHAGGESKGYMIWVWGEGNDAQWVHTVYECVSPICMQICTYAAPPSVNHGASGWSGWVEAHNHSQGGLSESSMAEWLVRTPSNTTKTSMLVTWGWDRWASQCVRYITENRKKKSNSFQREWNANISITIKITHIAIISPNLYIIRLTLL